MPTKSITKKQKMEVKRRVEECLKKRYPDIYPDPFWESCYDPQMRKGYCEEILDNCISEIVYQDSYKDVVAELNAGYKCTPKRAMYWLKKKHIETTTDGHGLMDRLKNRI